MTYDLTSIKVICCTLLGKNLQKSFLCIFVMALRRAIQDIYEVLSLTQIKGLVFFEETPYRAQQLLPRGHYHGDKKTYHHDKDGQPISHHFVVFENSLMRSL